MSRKAAEFSRQSAKALRKCLSESLLPAPPNSFEKYFEFYGYNQSLEGLSWSHKAAKVRAGDFELVAQLFTPEVCQGTVFIVHGYFDHVGVYRHIVQHCLKLNLSVMIFDLPGHGLSSGKAASIQSFDQYSDSFLEIIQMAKKEQLTLPWHAVGQSTGAAVLINGLQNKELLSIKELSSFTLLAPLVRPFAWKSSRVLFALASTVMNSSKRRFSINSHDQEFLDFLKHEDPLQSQRLENDWVKAMANYLNGFLNADVNQTEITVVQGTDDTTVDWSFNIRRIKDKFPNAQIHLIEEARHQLVNESKEYRGKVFEVLTDQLSS